MRARLPMFIAIAVGVAGSAGGCLLTSDFDGVVGVRPAEGGPGEEGGALGDGGADDAAVSPCATGKHVVCSDFDHPGGGFPVPGWNNIAGDAGVLSLDNASVVTKPLSLRAKVNGGAGGTSEAYIYRQAFLGTFQLLTISFDIRIEACPPQGNSLTLVYVEPSIKASFGLVVLSSGVQAIGASINGAPTFFQLEQQIPDQVWSHVVYRIMVKDASTAHLDLTVDGKKSVDTDAPSSAMRATALLNVGILGSAAAKGCEVQYDNYVLDEE
jgi:hypothetical protein